MSIDVAVEQSTLGTNSYEQSVTHASTDSRPAIWLGFAALVFLTCLFASWPIYRASLSIEIDENEGWNAYFADAAMGKASLYPSQDQLMTNNYPPVSFYIVGGLGKLIGDPVLAGRILSLLGVVVTSVGLGWIVHLMTTGREGSWLAGCVAGLFHAATMCRFYPGYVGMNDPQIFAQAIMTIGFAWFLLNLERQRGLIGPIAVMVFAGFIKHNIAVMPLAAFVWLGIRQPRRLLTAGLFAVSLIALGFLTCYLAFGYDFFANLMCPRVTSIYRGLGRVGHLQWMAVGLVSGVYLAFARRDDRSVQLCSILIGLSLFSFVLQSMGEGVEENAAFELVCVAAIAIGLLFAAPQKPSDATTGAVTWARIVLLFAISIRLLACTRTEPIRMFFDPSFQAEIELREAATRETVERIRSTSGDVFGCLYSCQRAGKRLVVHGFTLHQRIKKGRLPGDVLNKLITENKITAAPDDPLLRWSTKYVPETRRL